MILRGCVFSETLEMETGLTVLLPDSVDARPRRVVYLLHGLCGANGDWTNYSMLPVYARECGAAFVMPEVGRSFYADMRHGQRFGSYIADELPAICRRSFNISARPEDTAIMGNSMGGFGAMKTALARPGAYGYCAAFAPAGLFLAEQTAALANPKGLEYVRQTYGEQLIRDFHAIFGEDLQPGREERIMDLARNAADGDKPRLYVACGTGDDLLAENRRFRDETRELGYDVLYEEWEGGHDWQFFDQALKHALYHFK